MRGNPILRILAVGLLLLLAGIWVHRLTSDSPRAIGPEALPSPTPQQEIALEISLTTTEAWESCGIRHLDQDILTAPAGESETQKQIILMEKHLPADIIVDAKWKNAGNHALRIDVKQDGQDIFTTTLWGTQELQEAITIPFPSAP